MSTLMIISQILSQKSGTVISISPSATVMEAIKLMDEKGVGSLIVLNTKGKIAGIFTERDCFRKVILQGKSPTDVLVRAVMSKKVTYASPEDSIDGCMTLMTEKRIRHVPVLDNQEHVVGIVSIGDLVKFVASEQHAMIRNLEKYIEGSL